jgi:putative transposase
VLAERWRVHYNTVRPHSSLGYRPQAPQAWAASSLGEWGGGGGGTPTLPPMATI